MAISHATAVAIDRAFLEWVDEDLSDEFEMNYEEAVHLLQALLDRVAEIDGSKSFKESVQMLKRKLDMRKELLNGV